MMLGMIQQHLVSVRHKLQQNEYSDTNSYRKGEKFVLKPVDQYGNETGDEVSSTTIVVQNEKKGEIDNGVLLDTLPYILILVVVVGGGVLLFLRKRKNDDDE